MANSGGSSGDGVDSVRHLEDYRAFQGEEETKTDDQASAEREKVV